MLRLSRPTYYRSAASRLRRDLGDQEPRDDERHGASKRDYSLVGRDSEAAVANGLAAAEWYHTDIPRKQMKELMQRSDGPAIRDTLIWLGLLDGVRRRRRLVLGHLVVRAVLPRLRRALRLVDGFALARMRSRHRLQDALDERRGLPDRLLHDHAQSRHLALEPHAPPHRHDHRRPRSGNRRHAAAGPVARRAQFLRHSRRLARHERHGPQRVRQHQRRGKDLHPGDGTAARRSASRGSGWRSMSRRSRWRSPWDRSCR